MSVWNVAPPPGASAAPTVGGTLDPTKTLFIQREQIIRTPKVAYRGQPATTSTLLYTAPILTSSPTGTSPCTSLVKSIHVCNTLSSAVTYTMHAVESGGSVADNRAVFRSVAIAANTTHIFLYADDEFALADGETLNASATQAFGSSGVTFRITVVELTH